MWTLLVNFSLSLFVISVLPVSSLYRDPSWIMDRSRIMLIWGDSENVASSMYESIGVTPLVNRLTVTSSPYHFLS